LDHRGINIMIEGAVRMQPTLSFGKINIIRIIARHKIFLSCALEIANTRPIYGGTVYLESRHGTNE
jgi:hypothetical protein